MDFTPEGYQKQAIDFIVQNTFCGVFLETAVERTAIVLMAIQKLRYDYFLGNKILVVTTNTSARQLWCTEIKRWDNLSMIKYSHVAGTEKQRFRALRRKADIYMINIENFSWLLHQDLWVFDTLVLDELGMYRKEKGLRFQQILSIRSRVKRLIGMGTMPSEDKLEDLWAECYLLDAGARLGKSKSGFLEKYFFKNWKVINGKSILKTEVKKGAKETLMKTIGDLIYCGDAKVPTEEKLCRDIYLEMNPTEYSKYHWMESRILNETSNCREQYTFRKIKAMLCAANGIWKDADAGGYFHKRKLGALKRFIKENPDKKILIACCFMQDMEEIRKEYLHTLCIDSFDKVSQWNKRNYGIGIINPFSKVANKEIEEGTDILVWYSLPWSQVVYKRLNDNVNNGTKRKPIVRMVMLATVEEQLLLLLDCDTVEREELRECYFSKRREVYGK